MKKLWAFAIGELWFVALGLYAVAPAPPADVRRDATVEAVERVLPAVVNIRTEEVVQRGDAAQLDLIIPRRSGRIIQLQQAKVEVRVR